MNTIAAIHSFRRGTGKTTLAASLAVLLALRGRRVALVDTNFQSPGVHLFFGMSDGEFPHSFNDYLWAGFDVLSAVRAVNPKIIPNAREELFIVPASGRTDDILRSIRTPPNIDRYLSGLEKLEKELSLDLILVDSPAGLNENTLQTIAVSSAVVLVLHPNERDFQGTAVTVDMIRRLGVPAIHLVLNDVPKNLDVEDVRRQLEDTYRCEGSMVLEHSEELLALSSGYPFALEYPSHPLTIQLGGLAERLSG